MISSERALVSVVTDFLLQNEYRVRHEVPNMGQSIDIVASRGRYLTFLEAKLSDWRRALKQCRAHTLVADYICLAIARKSASSALIEETKELGYGLILCEPTLGMCHWELRPLMNDKIWLPQRQQWAKNLKKIEYVN